MSTGEMEGSNVLRAGRGKGRRGPRRLVFIRDDDGRGWVLNGTSSGTAGQVRNLD